MQFTPMSSRQQHTAVLMYREERERYRLLRDDENDDLDDDLLQGKLLLHVNPGMRRRWCLINVFLTLLLVILFFCSLAFLGYLSYHRSFDAFLAPLISEISRLKSNKSL